MGRRLRFIPPGGCLVEATNRTIQGRYLLTPSEELNSLLIGVLGRAQRLYGVTLHACVVLSNHYHLLLTVESARQLARFMGYFQGNLAKEAGRLHRWRGPFWHRRYQHVIVSDEEAAQVARLRYLLSNSCKEDLVSSPLDWPGVSSLRPTLLGEQLEGTWVDRSRKGTSASHQDRQTSSTCTSREFAVFEPLPCWSSMPPELVRTRVAELVAEIETETRARHLVASRKPLGAGMVCGQDPHSRPTRSKWSPAPLFHCASKEARSALREAYATFVAVFCATADRLASGGLLQSFPQGAFPPPILIGGQARAPT